ncbi:MAG: hypothetical protein LBP68_03220 [Acidobacteriota bacterium]|jgi:hypothetical protein|nr:hypothetical protein [Acidobacteriota bacterium]
MEFYEQELLDLLKAGKGRVSTDNFYASVRDWDGQLSVSLFNTKGGALEQHLRAGELEIRTPVVSYYPGQVPKSPDFHYYYQGREFKPSYDFIRQASPFYENLGAIDLSESIANCVTLRLEEFQENGYTCWSKDRTLLLSKGETAPVEGAAKLSFRKARKLWATKETGGISPIDDVYVYRITAQQEVPKAAGDKEGEIAR